MRIWDHHLREHPGARRLPAIIPLVVHHNRSAWTGPTDLRDLLDLPPQTTEAAQHYLPQFRFLLDDLAVLDEQALRARPLTPPARLTLLLLKITKDNPRLAADLRQWADQLHAVLDRPGGLDDLVTVVTYIEMVGKVPTDQLQDLFTQLGPEAKEAYVTTAEMLRAEGEARGERRGRAEGERRGRAEALVELLTVKFGLLPQAALDTVHAATADQLRAWTARVLTANTLNEILS